MNSPGIFYLDFYKQICKILQYRGVIDNTLFRFKVHCTLNPTTNPNPNPNPNPSKSRIIRLPLHNLYNIS